MGKVIRPYTIDSSSASRHHTDSLGASTAKEKSFDFKFYRIDELPDMISPPVIPVVEKFKARYRAGDV